MPVFTSHNSPLSLGETGRCFFRILFPKPIIKSAVIFIIFFSFFNCTKPVRQSAPLTAEFHYNSGLELLKLDDTDNAQREFRYAIELDDHFAPAHLGLAVLYYKNEQYAVSEHHINEAIRLKSHWADAYLLKGKILFQKEEYEQALETLNRSADVFSNGNGNHRKALKLEIFLWRGLCLKNLNKTELAGIEFAKVLKLDENNKTALQALDEIRLMHRITAGYPQWFVNKIHKKAISRSDWAAMLAAGLSNNFNSGLSNNNKRIHNNLPDINAVKENKDLIKTAIEKKWVNIYPDGEFKPDLNLSWGEVIISVKNILNDLPINYDNSVPDQPPFNDLESLHPLYDCAVWATALGVFNNLSQTYYSLSASVKGTDALHVIVNVNKIINKEL